ncbi:MAG: hypothetical protein GF329_12910 [Candidatus Lokiarchaeota archaeon]|nr:hypothetical protein [Candidatus Lokiarchaeota archaeon]
MTDLKTIIIGDDEIVLLFGLLGIKGIIINGPELFQEEFNNLINDNSIGLIIVALELPESYVRDLMEFKIKNRKPFVSYLPNIFKMHLEREDIIFQTIYSSIKKIIRE